MKKSTGSCLEDDSTNNDDKAGGVRVVVVVVVMEHGPPAYEGKYLTCSLFVTGCFSSNENVCRKIFSFYATDVYTPVLR